MRKRTRPDGKSTLTLRTAWAAAIVALAAALVFIGGAVGTGTPTIQSDKADYNPGSTVTLTGSSWDTGGTTVHIDVNDSVGATWSHSADVPVAPDGTIRDSFQLPITLIASYSVAATQQTSSGTLTATSSFTDAAGANLDQCANGSFTSSATDCPAGGATDGDWQNGDLNANNSHFREGDSVPFRIVFSGLSGTNSVTISWQATNSPSQHAYDYLTTWKRTVTSADPCDGVSGCVLGSPSASAPVPADPTLAAGCGFTGSQVAGAFTMWGGTIDSVSAYGLSGCAPTSANTDNSITINFTASVPNPVIAWGGHIASSIDWGQGNSASAISGSPYHMALDSCSFNCGAQDRALKASGVLPEPTIVTQVSSTTATVGTTSITDTATLTGPNGTVTGSVAFFVCGPTGSATPCVSGGASAGTKPLSGGGATSDGFTPSAPGTYCFRVEYTPDASAQYSPGVSSVTTNECFTATNPPTQLKLVKTVTKDDGGTAVPDNWTLSATAASPNNGDNFSNAGGSGVFNSVFAGVSYTLAESGGPAGYTAGDWSCNGGTLNAAKTAVTLAVGNQVTCTINNNDNGPQLKLVKTVTKDDGGTASPDDWNLSATAASPNNGRNFNNAGGSGVFNNVFAGASYALSEQNGPAGYTAGDWSCDGGTLNAAKTAVTLGLGDKVTCTINNNDNTPQLKLVKTVTKDDGGTAVPNDWNLSATAASPTTRNFNNAGGSGVFNNVFAGTSYALSEQNGPAGYTAGDWSCDGGTLNAAKTAVTLSLGDKVTCTINNDDIAPQLKLVKTVTKDDGGTASPDDWNLSATAASPTTRNFNNAGGSGAFNNVFAGTSYALSEQNGPAGYTAGDWSCDGGTLNAAKTAITLGLGDKVTCTINNNDNAPQLKLVKTVTKDDGGTAVPNDWNLSASAASPSNGRNFNNAGGSGVFNNVFAGTSYALSEQNGPAGYTAGDWSCDGGTLNAAKTAVTLGLGDKVTCTINNNDNAPQLKLVKTVTKDDGGRAIADDWNLSAAAATPNNGRNFNNAGGSGVFNSVFANASYTIAESGGPAGYTAGDWSCDGGTLNAAKTAITLGLGDKVTCTINNNDNAPQLKLVKTVTRDDGGTAVPNDWNLSASAASPSNGRNFNNAGGSGTFNNVFAGASYALSEQNGPAGYTAGDWSCDGGTLNAAKTAVTLSLGDKVTCTINNNDNPPQLKLVKTVTKDDGGTAIPDDWNLSATAASPTTRNFNNAGGSGVFNNVFAGASYTLSEQNGPAGYTAGAWSCDGGTLNAAKTAVTLGLGDKVTCTINNNDNTPQLKLVKTVTKDDGGTAVPNDWNLSATAASPSNGRNFNNAGGSGSFNNVFAGASYALSEQNGPAGYTAGDWSCDGGTLNAAKTAITLGLGAKVTCTINNNDNAPQLKLVKTVTKDNGGTAVPNDWNLSAAAASPTTRNFNNAGGSGVFNNVFANASYALSEQNGPAGYTAGAWSCDGGTLNAAKTAITLGLGDKVTCTINNNDNPPKIVIIKNAKPASGTFSFGTTGSSSGPGTSWPTNFTLNGDPTGGANTKSYFVDAGAYTVKEGTQLSWTLTGIGGSTDVNTPYNCVVTGSGGSTGLGDLNTQTVTINIRVGDVVTCTFENTGNGATRTQGFWATHAKLSAIAWNGTAGQTVYGHVFPGVVTVMGDDKLCGTSLTININGAAGSSSLLGGFWASVSTTTTNKKRSTLGNYRMQLLQQLLAAELNAVAFGSAPSGGVATINSWEAAFCTGTTTDVKNAQQAAASFNSQGDNSTFTPGTSADSKNARSLANLGFWDFVS